MVAKGPNARTVEGLTLRPLATMFAYGRIVEDLELLSVNIAVLSLIARIAEGVRYANMERYDLHVRNV